MSNSGLLGSVEGSGEPVMSLGESEAMLGPVLMGAMVQILLYGFVLSHLLHFAKSPTWRRSSALTKIVVCVVMLLNTAYTGFVGHDIWYFGTLPRRQYDVVVDGSLIQGIEPIVLGAIALIVQTTLALRSSRIMNSTLLKCCYLFGVGSLALLSFLGAIGTVGSSVRLNRDIYENWAGLQLSTYLVTWMWAACATDVTITITYLVLLRHRLGRGGGNEITDSVVRRIGQLMVRSAAYTAVFAAAAALCAQLFSDEFYIFTLVYTFAMPLGSLYTLSLATTLAIGDRIQAELGQHISPCQQHSHLSAFRSVSLNDANLIPERPAPSRMGSYREDGKEEKAFQWAQRGARRGEDLV